MNKFHFFIVSILISSVAANGAAPSITQIELPYVFESGAVITWDTDILALSEVEYGLTASYGEIGISPIGLTTDHSVTLHQLEPDTLYHYRIRSTNDNNEVAYSNSFTFMTTVVPDFDSICIPSATANDYPVGPGQTYENIGDVPWENLGPGDTVRIFWREAPYKEKFRIGTRGTPEAPIRICGIPGPNGERPVIDGKDATTRPQLNYVNWGTDSTMEDFATVLFNAPYGERPGYIALEGLCVRGAYEDNSYIATDGSERTYITRGAASIRIQKGDNIVIRNCEITDSSNGLFVLSVPPSIHVSREIRIEGNYIHNNGSIGSDREHSSYVQTLGVIYRFNHYGPLRPGAIGSSLKDRSSGTVIAYNWIEGGAHALDLVEGEEHFELTTRDIRYRKTYVYGNILRVGQEGSIIHYGGDNGNTPIYRKGTLYFFNNTIHAIDDRWRTTIFDLATNDETAEIFNNILYRQGTSKFQILSVSGVVNLGPNWISTGWESSHDYKPFEGTLTGTENLIIDSAPPMDIVTYQLPTGSSVVNAGMSLLPEIVSAGHTLSNQINTTIGSESFPISLVQNRIVNGSAIDLGATEVGLPDLPDQILSVTPSQNSINVALDTDLHLELTNLAIFDWTIGSEIRLYESGLIEPVWTYDPAGSAPEPANPSGSTPDPNQGSKIVIFDIPGLSPNTIYYVLTGDETGISWARIDGAPWYVGNFVDSSTWSFRTGDSTLESILTFDIWLEDYYDHPLTVDEASPDADPNQNGVSNLLEYAFDFSSPSASANQFLPEVGTFDDGVDRWVTLDWRKINGATDLSYDVEYSYDLTGWKLIDDDDEIEFTQIVLDSNPDDDDSANLTRTRVKATTDSFFLRLNVSEL